MGGVNSIINVFDINSYGKEEMQKMGMQPAGNKDDSFVHISGENEVNTGQQFPRLSFGLDML